MWKLRLNLVLTLIRFIWPNQPLCCRGLDDPSKWKTYVAKTENEILSCCESRQWKHVASEYNPADCASRGVLPSRLINPPLLWTGPEWFNLPPMNYTASMDVTDSRTTKKEIKEAKVNIAAEKPQSILTRSSHYNKPLRTVVFCLRCKYRDWHPDFLSTQEILWTKLVCVRLSQQEFFAHELQMLRRNKNIPSSSRLLSLNPYLDSSGWAVNYKIRISNSHRNIRLSSILNVI